MTLRTNNITDEAGTGGPDFVAMPTVGGDPIVESGSNANGEWVKFSDGTMIVSSVALDAIFDGNNDLLRINFTSPQAFITHPRVFKASLTSTTGAYAGAIARETPYTLVSSATDYFLGYAGVTASESITAGVFMEVMGKWK